MAHPKNPMDTLSGDNHWHSRVKVYKEELRNINKHSKEILMTLEVFNLKIVEDQFRSLNNHLHETEAVLGELNDNENTELKNKFFNLYESTQDSFDKLLLLYDFYVQLQDKKEEWSNEYFSLWEKTYALRSRIDEIYVKEEKMNVHYGAMSDYKYQSVRKRNLYEACINIYNVSLLELKSTGDCDHYERIQILTRLLPVLKKCEKLSFSENTRGLEKDLRKEEETQKMARLIIDYDIGKE
jgi:hypothetical protein